MTDRIILLEPAGRHKYRVRFAGKEIGVWKDPEFTAARYLLDNGLAERGDRLRSFRDNTPCIKGGVGWLADRRTAEDDSHGGRPYFTRWRPFPARTDEPGVASDDPEVS